APATRDEEQRGKGPSGPAAKPPRVGITAERPRRGTRSSEGRARAASRRSRQEWESLPSARDEGRGAAREGPERPRGEAAKSGNHAPAFGHVENTTLGMCCWNCCANCNNPSHCFG